jgi:hypothetical protein
MFGHHRASVTRQVGPIILTAIAWLMSQIGGKLM